MKPQETPRPAGSVRNAVLLLISSKSSRQYLLSLWAACSLASVHAQTAPAAVPDVPAASAKDKEDDILVLSPFQVEADSEQGYLATQTLSGTRLKTELRDVGASMTIFTESLMNDLAATTVNDVLAFAPNTDPFVNRTSTAEPSGNDHLNNGTIYVTRGGSTNIVGQNFFSNGVPPDTYNSEAFTFTRGPNAILFGLGNPAGAFVSSTKRARPKNAYGIDFRTDSNGSFRTSVDLNQVLIKNRLFFRYAGLYEESQGFRDPSDGLQRRHFFTVTYTPFSKTSIRVNYERGRHEVMAIRPWPVYDGITPWIAAGSPLLNNVGAVLPAGIVRTGYTGNILVSTEWSSSGSFVPTMNWRNQGRTIDPVYPDYPVAGGVLTLMDSSLFPMEANVIGAGSSRKQNFTNASIFVEQQIGRNLFIEAAINKTTTDLRALNSVIGNFNILRVDVNRQLPNGQSNPNVGKYYIESYSTLINAPGESLSRRVMLSYELDLSRKKGWLGDVLGKHRLAAFYEDNTTDSSNSNNGAFNVTPLSGFVSTITNVANRVNFRYYLDPATGIVSAGRDTSFLPQVYAGTPIPNTTDASGVTLAYVQNVGGVTQVTELETQAVALQSQFWQGRLVLTNGWRQDKRAIYRAQATDFLPWQDERLIYPDPASFDAKRDFPNSRQDGRGQTFTRGAVFHVLPWLSLSYNHSNNFQPSTSRNVYGDLLPNPEGDGSDYGIRFGFLGNRIVGEVSYYENFTRNRADETIRGGVSGNFKATIDQIWENIALAENKSEYQSFPYSDRAVGWADALTTKSDGYEFSITTNLTPAWRFTINGSKRSDGETAERAPYIKAYLAQWIPAWKANPQWYNVTGVATRVADLERFLQNLEALANFSDDAFAPRWALNLVTSYSFKQRVLKGFSLGGSMNMRGSTIAGFAEDAGLVIDPTHPYYVRGYTTIGTWLTYQRKLFKNKVSWRVQLNVRNLLDESTVSPLRIVDKRDGTHEGAVATVRLSEPRTYVLTSSFKF